MPTNILLAKLRTRRGLKWGVPAMGLALVYLFAAATCVTLVERGWSPWLYLVFAICLWNALKFLLFGPISAILLIRARITERRARRRDLRAERLSGAVAVSRP
ncbi:sulfate permease [Georgenia sp. TF02-10]|uniref:sulfate permease n=1 Tax=Georgenia sp. TF02-10 TaxID=2917725 RepID=UPI001FA763A9|nr:sulfate permease [Georgenia sp. TF02-10]UNX53587.1 sulfate permease [Georgenia sp. TF02-10]